MEGRIVAVLETWPLQLDVEGEAGRWSVALSPKATVQDGDAAADPSRLRNGQRVAVAGRETGPRAMLADSITILR